MQNSFQSFFFSGAENFNLVRQTNAKEKEKNGTDDCLRRYHATRTHTIPKQNSRWDRTSTALDLHLVFYLEMEKDW